VFNTVWLNSIDLEVKSKKNRSLFMDYYAQILFQI